MRVTNIPVTGSTSVPIVGYLVEADGTIKLNRKTGANAVICDLFDGDELDLAFGRENVVHASVANGGLTEKLLDSLRRWAQYSGVEMNDTDKRR